MALAVNSTRRFIKKYVLSCWEWLMIQEKIRGFLTHFMRLTFVSFLRREKRVLATKLGNHIATVVHAGHTGFIPDRFSFSNVCLLLSTFYSQHYKDTRRAILSLDAQKVFDQTEWRWCSVPPPFCHCLGTSSDRYQKPPRYSWYMTWWYWKPCEPLC